MLNVSNDNEFFNSSDSPDDADPFENLPEFGSVPESDAHPDHLELDPMVDECNVRLSENAVDAYIEVNTSPGKSIPVDIVLNALARENIKVGIRKEALELLISERGSRGKPVLIARGKPPIDGKDGRIKYYFEADPKPKIHIDQRGKVDYRETGVIQSVNAGQLLAVRIPPTTGEDGQSVTGAIIQSKPGKEATPKPGVNTAWEDAQETRLIATRDGSVRLRENGVIEVTETFELNGDVDLACGHIYFDGHVHIRGDVRSGFKVIASGNIEISGVVEDAFIHCGGDLLVRRGVVGSGKGRIWVCGDTYIRFFENQKLVSNGDVEIAEAVLFSDITCGGSLTVNHGKGAIIGGISRVGREVEARIIGNIHYTETNLVASYHPQEDRLIDIMQEALSQESVTREKLQEAIAELVKKKYSRDGIEKEEEEGLETLYRLSYNLEQWTELLHQTYSDMFEQRTRSYKHGFFKIGRKIYPGVRLTIGDARKKIDEEHDSCYFIYQNGKIEKSHRYRT